MDGIKDGVNSMKSVQEFYTELSNGDSEFLGLGKFYDDDLGKKIALASLIPTIKGWKNDNSSSFFKKGSTFGAKKGSVLGASAMKRQLYAKSMVKQKVKIDNFLASTVSTSSSSRFSLLSASLSDKLYYLQLMQMFVNKASDILSTYSSDKNVEATRASMFLRRYKFTDKKRLLLNEIVFSENSDVAKAKKEAGEKKKEKEEKKEREREKEKEKKEKKTTETKKKKYSKKK
jgi:hypothetical protein